MSMEMLNTLQFVELLCGYLGCTVLLPALVFYRKVKAFPAAGRFLIYFTIGNFYIINLVQVLELAYLSCRGTLLLFTLVPAGVAAVRIYQIPVGAYGRKLVQELRHFVLREMGFRSFVHHRLREAKRFLCFIGRQLVRLLKEVWPDLVFLAVFLGVLWKVCWPGILNNWGFGASDLPVHNYWINGLIDNKLYIAGIYPMGMHCMLYYLSTVLCIPAYAVLRLFWLIQYSMIAAVLLAFLKGCCKSRFLPWLGATGFVGLNYANGYGGTIPEVSREEAGKPLPANNGINAYNGTDRAVTMSRMYYWAQAFQRLYPYEMKVYFENDRFVCYYLEQNTYRLYNLAIDYGFNRG